MLKRVPPMWEFARRTEEHLKGMIAPGTLFEELGFNYLGPFDGHDLPTLLRILNNVKTVPGPQFVHVITQKGKGYAPAEADPIKYHAVKAGYLDLDRAAEKPPAKPSKPTYSNIFGQWLCDMAEIDPNVVAITPAMREGSDLINFAAHYPERYFDVGIAEQHAVTVAAGMACDGLKPVVAIYSTFLQRAYDQLIHDVALQKLPVLLALDRSGLVGGDGCTHNGSYDIAYLRCIPDIVLMAASDENELRQMLYTGIQLARPVAVRYPRGSGPGVPVNKTMTALPLGKAELRREGVEVALLAWGSMVNPALKAGEKLNATVVNMRFIKPLDEALILNLVRSHKLLVTIEEGVIAGGVGSAVSEFLAREKITCSVLHLGLPDQPIEHGDPDKLLAEVGLKEEEIVNRIFAHDVF